MSWKVFLMSVLLILSGNGNAIIISTGDLGNNVITEGGTFSVTLNISSPSNTLPASIDVKYGGWTSPAVLVDTFMNETFVGSFLTDKGYISPGPEFATLNATGLLLDGSNEISFSGGGPCSLIPTHPVSSCDYVIGQVDLTYSPVPVPEPGTLALVGIGLLGLVFSQRKRISNR